jgi:hypothetical protein
MGKNEQINTSTTQGQQQRYNYHDIAYNQGNSCKPIQMPRGLTETAQTAFIESYKKGKSDYEMEMDQLFEIEVGRINDNLEGYQLHRES